MSKNVIVTGTTGNLGSAVAKKFISEGYQVIGSKSNGRISPEDGVHYFEADLTDENSTREFFNLVLKQFNKIEAGIFLVGGFGMGNIENTTDTDIRKLFSLNFMTAYHCAQNAYKYFKMNGSGKMVLVGAKPALEGGGSEMLAYTISKSAVIKLAELLNETGKKDNIQTSVIIPSVIDTPLNRSSMPNATFSDWVTPEAIAEATYFLISKKGDALRDTVLKIYGNS
ncbi:MAG: NAD(P)-dependent dehydrogenase (short-subunit alcohol dehydrogenase family) [Cyclobacteriaceae bacterium]|jgi:NAD(P)-dependent dehydrogenase (short-subunit alcohol dehydrogenase family)